MKEKKIKAKLIKLFSVEKEQLVAYIILYNFKSFQVFF
jgi:hypothetical protein